MHRLASTIVLALIVLGFTASSSWAQLNPTTDEIRERVDRLTELGALTILDRPVGATEFVVDFYVDRKFGRAWRNPTNVDALMAAIADSPAHGLTPADYHADALRSLLDAPADNPGYRANLDILLTDAAALLLRHLFFGKVDPTAIDPRWNFERPFVGAKPIEFVQAALANGRIADLIARASLDHPIYLALQDTLAEHRAIAAKGGWDPVPPGNLLRPGAVDARVPALRARLIESGDYAGDPANAGDVYDDDMVAAVVAYQTRHRLDADGIVGPATLRALNTTVAARIDQIRVNMERARWVLRELSNDRITVNVAGFYVNVVKDGRLLWRTNAIVGTPFHKTPIFRDEMRYLVFNPTWTVPRGITGRSILPKVKEDPAYLRDNNFAVVDSAGNEIDPATIDWQNVTLRTFKYWFVQRPGDDNALGRVKFMFPNEFSVYLHDTPARDLFGESRRAFSSGCTRVEDPLFLAHLLLADQGWDRARIDALVASGETTTVLLEERMPVLFLYWTIDQDGHGGIQFYDDVYDRDGPVLQALNSPLAEQPAAS